ncbi:hypothetical protein SL057_002387 [Flavobacterium psychrophilum]|nr:hypothetical protein [Flavobacterium psychrophilum]
MIFKATLDKTAKLLTVGITLLFLGIAIGPKLFGKSENAEIPILISFILFLTYIISYAFSPKSYELNGTNVIIKRPFNNVTLNRSQIKNILKLENGKLTWSIRTFGVGGLFGYFGKFWSKEFGNMTWYATRRDKAIMIITKENKKIVLTPDEVEKFINEFTEIEKQQPNG